MDSGDGGGGGGVGGTSSVGGGGGGAGGGGVRTLACLSSAAAVWLLVGGLTVGQLVTVLLGAWVLTGGWRTVRMAWRTLPRDARAAVRFGTVVFKMKTYEYNNYSVVDLFAQTVKAQPDKTAILFEEQRWTFRELDEYSNRVGNYFLSLGVTRGQCVALFMDNRPQYCALWLGLAKIGAVPALVNFNLRRAPLLHCVASANCTALVFGTELADAVADIRDDLSDVIRLLYCCEPGQSAPSLSGAKDLEAGLLASPVSPPMLTDRVGYHDKMLYIYTSGTTGLPKAAIIKHSRGLLIATGTYQCMGWRRDDVLYTPLPQYHTAGALMGTLTALLAGCSVAQRRRFSVQHFWSDCVRHRATVSQYIGETCRYLLNQPEKPEDKIHQVRLMFGNGLRPQLWAEFQQRFNVARICEFYGSTEGNTNVINMDGKPGAVGFVPPLVPWIYPCLLIRVDETSGEPLRDQRGLCVPCRVGEPGEFVGLMIRGDSTRDFHGYADNSSTQKKIVFDVRRKGDKAFRSGDILVQDEDGYLYFMDRTGDTFRWKGENVSTSEVEGVIQRALDNSMAAVYGVNVPGCEGRAGMAALALGPAASATATGGCGGVDLKALASAVKQQLPAYARPLFVRCVKQLDMTGTFKFKKVDLKKEGFDLDKVSDAMFFWDAKLGQFVPLTRHLYTNIVNGNLRL